MPGDPYPFPWPQQQQPLFAPCFHPTPPPTPGAIAHDIYGAHVSKIDDAYPPAECLEGIVRGVWSEPQSIGDPVLKFLVIDKDGLFHTVSAKSVRLGPYKPSEQTPTSD